MAEALADHVASTAALAGLLPLIVTADGAVGEWATRAGFPSIGDPGDGLDAAARTGVEWAGASDSTWLVVHADLPLLSAADLEALAAPIDEGPVIAPSSDGGTSAIGARGPADFAFGDSSFHRHVVMFPGSKVVTRPGLLLDLDSPDDLEAASSAPRGAWIKDLLGQVGDGATHRNLY